MNNDENISNFNQYDTSALALTMPVTSTTTSHYVESNLIYENNNTSDFYSNNNNNNNQNGFLDTLSEKIYFDMIDDVIFGLMLQVHRAAKLDYFMFIDPDPNYDPEYEKQFEIYDDNDVLGVFSNLNENNKITASSGRNGQSSGLLKYECVCPNCDRSLAAVRFAPHLEKCMGMGRNSSRIATRRIANYNGDELDQLIEATGLIPNPRYLEQTFSNTSSKSNTTNNNNTTTTHEDDLMSIINAVATANESINPSSSSSSLIDIELSSSSSSCSNNYSTLKPPTAKKKRLQNSKSVNSNISSSSTSAILNQGSNSLQTSNTIHNLSVTNQNQPTTTIATNSRSNYC